VTQRTEDIIRLYHEEYKSLADIGKVYGLSRERVRQILKAAGRPSNPTEDRRYAKVARALPIDEIVNAYIDGDPTYKLTERYHITSETLTFVLKRNGVDVRNFFEAQAMRAPKGLTEEKLFELYIKEGFSQEGIARMFNTSQAIISRYIRKYNLHYGDRRFIKTGGRYRV
jgi:DNA-directed RNA polymerase specialized sigma subunit